MRVYVCINGIHSNPGASDGWTDRGVTWLNIHTEGQAEKFEYACSAIFRRLKQQQRAEAIAKMLRFYHDAGYEITLIGHSNGCDLIARVLDLVPYIFVSIHLFAAAADGVDFKKAIDAGRIGRLFLYVSANDHALRLAKLSQQLFGWAGLGFGSLGRDVPAWCTTDRHVTIIRRDDYDHPDWFGPGEKFEETMHTLLGLEQLISKQPAHLAG